MRTRTFLGVGLAAVLAAGCNPTVDNNASAVDMVITGFNDEGDGVVAKFFDVIDDFGNPQELTLFVELRSVPKSAEALNALYAIELQGYTVSWVRTDIARSEPGVTVPFPRTYPTGGFMDAGGEAEVEMILVPREMTLQAPLRNLYFGTERAYTAMTIRVFGRDLVNNAVAASETFPIIFGDF